MFNQVLYFNYTGGLAMNIQDFVNRLHRYNDSRTSRDNGSIVRSQRNAELKDDIDYLNEDEGDCHE